MGGRKATPIKERILSKIAVTPSGCWEYQGTIGVLGYGKISVGSRSDGSRTIRVAHKVAYEVFVGPVPEGLQLDHLCRNRKCVNPSHLEPVTPSENVQRGLVPLKNKSKTHCPHGHEYAGGNVILERDGSRKCRICKNERMRRWWAKNGAEYEKRRPGRVR